MARRRSISWIMAALCSAAAAATGGCKETVKGEYLDTEGIALVADVTAHDEDESELRIEFLVGGDESNTYVDLADDEVTAGADGEDKRLSPRDKGVYRTTFPTGEGGTEFTIELDRSDDDKSDATDTSGTLPDPFEVGVPEGDVSRQDALTITWEPFGDAREVRIDVDGDCVFFTFVDDEDDDGEFRIPAEDLIFGSEDEEGECEAEVTVTRTRRGSTDDVFDSESKFRLHQVRTASFTSVP